MERPTNEPAHDAGRSAERVKQDELLEREARRESWLTRLMRSRWFAKGRPEPGNTRGNDSAGKTERSRR
jgi:hypothetical protein